MTLALAACGGGGGNQNNGGGSDADGPSGTITVWEHDYSFEDSLKEIINGFNKQYPNVKVEYQIRADGDY